MEGSDIEIADVNDVNDGGRSASRTKGRGRWTKALDTLLIQEVLARGAHLARHGEGQNVFEEVAEELNKNPSFTMETDWKHAKDRTSLLTRKHRGEDHKRMRASGTEEEYDTLCVLLTDLCHEVDQAKRESARQRRAETAKQEKLDKDGFMIRTHAVKRVKRSSLSSDGGASSRRKRSRSQSLGEAEEWQKMNEIEETRTSFLQRRLKLDEQMFEEQKLERKEQREIERRRIEEQKQDREEQREIERRRIELDEKKRKPRLAKGKP